MTWIWATLLLILVAPFVLWPLLHAAPLDDEAQEAGGPEPPASGD